MKNNVSQFLVLSGAFRRSFFFDIYNRKSIIFPMTKLCITCNQQKPYEEFWTDNKAKDKHMSSCKECTREYKKRWMKKNKSHIRQYNTEWREKNPDKRRSEWMKARAREHGITEQDWDQITEVYDYWKSHGIDSNKCYYCEKELGESFHIDHDVPYNKGGTNDMNNLYPACERCNRQKGEMTIEQYNRYKSRV